MCFSRHLLNSEAMKQGEECFPSSQENSWQSQTHSQQTKTMLFLQQPLNALIHFCISPLTQQGTVTITDPCMPHYTHKVLQNALNATNTSHSSHERRTCGLGDVSVEFRIIYCQLCFLYLFWTAEPFIDASLRFGCRAEKRRRTFFPETWVWHCLNVRYLNSFYVCIHIKKTLKMCFFCVILCYMPAAQHIRCSRMSVLRGMYWELKGFVVGRAIRRAEERS